MAKQSDSQTTGSLRLRYEGPRALVCRALASLSNTTMLKSNQDDTFFLPLSLLLPRSLALWDPPFSSCRKTTRLGQVLHVFHVHQEGTLREPRLPCCCFPLYQLDTIRLLGRITHVNCFEHWKGWVCVRNLHSAFKHSKCQCNVVVTVLD